MPRRWRSRRRSRSKPCAPDTSAFLQPMQQALARGRQAAIVQYRLRDAAQRSMHRPCLGWRAHSLRQWRYLHMNREQGLPKLWQRNKSLSFGAPDRRCHELSRCKDWMAGSALNRGTQSSAASAWWVNTAIFLRSARLPMRFAVNCDARGASLRNPDCMRNGAVTASKSNGMRSDGALVGITR